jgi:hypothetical protein
MLCLAIDNPATYEIRAVIRFLRAASMSSAVCGQIIMSEGTVRQLRRTFIDGRRCRPSVMSDNLAQSERLKGDRD